MVQLRLFKSQVAIDAIRSSKAMLRMCAYAAEHNVPLTAAYMAVTEPQGVA